MLSMLSRNWWVFVLRGVLAALFGILALIWPGATLLTLVLLFGAYALADGVFAVVAGISSYGSNERWWAMLLAGLAGIGIGLLTFFWPGVTAMALLYFIAAWAVIRGVFEIVAAIQMRRVITGEWLMILGGVLSVIFGLLLVIFPGTGALSLILVIGAFAILFGIMLVILGVRLRGMRGESDMARAASRS